MFLLVQPMEMWAQFLQAACFLKHCPSTLQVPCLERGQTYTLACCTELQMTHSDHHLPKGKKVICIFHKEDYSTKNLNFPHLEILNWSFNYQIKKREFRQCNIHDQEIQVPPWTQKNRFKTWRTVLCYYLCQLLCHPSATEPYQQSLQHPWQSTTGTCISFSRVYWPNKYVTASQHIQSKTQSNSIRELKWRKRQCTRTLIIIITNLC